MHTSNKLNYFYFEDFFLPLIVYDKHHHPPEKYCFSVFIHSFARKAGGKEETKTRPRHFMQISNICSVFIFKHNCVQNYVSVLTFVFKKMQKVFKEGLRLFLVFGCFGIWSGALSANDDIVSFLPGLPHQPSFRQYSGYLNAQGTKKLHYW